MFKIFRYLKPFIVSIVAVVMLLVVQAVCDLSLPDYTSNIVNVGIQQSGIENAVPKVIRESELNKNTLFMNNSDKEKIEESYTLLDKNKLSKEEYDKEVKQYPALKKQPIYKLNTKDEATIDELNKIMSKSMMRVAGIEMASEKGAIPNIPQNMDIWTVLEQMPADQLNQMTKEIDKNINKLDDSMLTQASINSVKSEYEKVGLDVEKLQTNYIFKSGGIMLLVALISMAATVTVGFLAAKIAAGMGKNLRKDVFRKVVGFSNVEFDKFSTASLITRSTNDIQQIQTLMVMLVRMVFYAPILGIGGVIKVLDTDTSMAWIIGVAVVAILSLVSVLFALAIPRFKKVQKLVDKLNLVTRESLTGMLVIRAFGTQKIEEERFDETNGLLRKTNTFVNRIMSMMMPMMMLIMNIITILIVWVGAHNVDAGSMQVGDMMAFIQYAMQIIMSFLMISMLSVILPRASVSATRISEVLNTDISIKDTKNTKKLDESKEGYVEFKNVSFKYPDAEDDVISDINFTAKPGETTAFIGSTGSGKSTLINLIPRFFDTTSGEVLVNGVNIKEVSQHELRDKIGYVPQKGVLFSGTIDSNIRYGVQDATKEEIEKASTIAQAMEFIQDKPDRFETEIAQGGTNVSGGQKQRLSIARALAKKPRIFIFDDSFSALDLKTDAKLRRDLKPETKDSTVLIVAQRISTIMNADQIIVLDEGKMVGKGKHEELLQDCEVYKQIALSQLSKEELAHE
ncbi:ABC transporter ATP-binding protein [Romboutsia lituseburensis]|uniref:ATP-binding cassette, subfamily B n=1 Tax=Romboutsia lituseburensis DSM 797 TaxID=1121325 RepID=A0A1G9S7B1_9FIRM|nr:ABC transporter ATP-binding protein [Romboutsia lituseburensis]CEH32939.1 Lipid A export ATP-binding/permease protein MsbA [Romboutsia lituseburensis]SDM30665.1 ATP-binding cassette, subfamily B [Romboutsia lituseburensis DSM 797]